MTDLEMVRKCAERMGYLPVLAEDAKPIPFMVKVKLHPMLPEEIVRYDPLEDDAQAMALVVKFRLRVLPQANGYWCADNGEPTPFVCGGYFLGQGDTPNRAIVECVAKLEG